ncbi:hypothetical protein ALC62_02245 [Cyphomyrmex costatus]|uniref:BED-type domain-containing protein n=1 Tax=Cyphomyrmex costatus TaxID=456900 RepID=A0A151IN75_9HYME|nr:hypothetical protein ALC62_02245 [Cyphomyrmex costatus]
MYNLCSLFILIKHLTSIRARYNTQKYRKEWEKLEAVKDWLNPSTSNLSKAYCKYCKVLLNAKLGDLIKHGQTLKEKLIPDLNLFEEEELHQMLL